MLAAGRGRLPFAKGLQGALRSSRWGVAARGLAVDAARLQELEQRISLGLLSRLASASVPVPAAGTTALPTVAVIGHSSAAFAATLRAVRKAGVPVAPVDISGCDAEELKSRLADAEVQLAVTAGLQQTQEAEVHSAVQRLGATPTSAVSLHNEGCAFDSSEAADATDKDGASLLLYSCPPGASVARVSALPTSAFAARVSRASKRWEFSNKDTVLQLGLRSDNPAAIVDAIEAPLSLGAGVAWPDQPAGRTTLRAETVWDAWAAIRDTEQATVVFIAPELCWRLLDVYSQLSSGLRATLSARWEAKPWRLAVAVATPGTEVSQELSEKWASIFRCPLTWHFSSAEAGSLFATTPTDQASHGSGSPAVEGLQWQVQNGELYVRGDGLSDGFYNGATNGKPQTLLRDDGFCPTGHRVAVETDDVLVSMPSLHSTAVDKEAFKHMYRGPRAQRFRMKPNWSIQRVLMRKYWVWRHKGKYNIVTKKHCNTYYEIYYSKNMPR
eukprot:CAMPEP_0178411278 /NCGR_PEP_ID=MMETSP0689_2-20121128/21411_1 /TAXON_ID=160604 /ORGANISM="Amphidinium massartii, Strain CS-259" /LENGTH=498 /DNA_ID=CAMNT_0020032477 /DNA_START=43 /DNA_END=1536 /DNA_ORIENTATION=-